MSCNCCACCGVLSLLQKAAPGSGPDSTTSGGGAVAVSFAAAIAVAGSVFQHNAALGGSSLGGAFLSSNNGPISMTGCSFHNNSAGRRGGAVVVQDTAAFILFDSNFTSNGRLPGQKQQGGGDVPHTETGGALCLIGLKASETNSINATIQRCRYGGRCQGMAKMSTGQRCGMLGLWSN